jgi:FKBP-type peptidyl-prolyl cis-trans isomerase (trigger factor)
LILAAIAQKEQISVSDEEFDVALAKKAEDFQVSLDFFRDQLDKGPGTDDLRAAVLQEKLYKFIEAQAEITEEKKAAAPEGHTEAEKE